ncbi:hypothetical protein [Georgenia alba]|uniref:Uncharacterized protein n=1 Tax=Georgenia alba TaxID=2233858 RepID=A0ABW2QBE5_9MICO
MSQDSGFQAPATSDFGQFTLGYEHLVTEVSLATVALVVVAIGGYLVGRHRSRAERARERT